MEGAGPLWRGLLGGPDKEEGLGKWTMRGPKKAEFRSNLHQGRALESSKGRGYVAGSQWAGLGGKLAGRGGAL